MKQKKFYKKLNWIFYSIIIGVFLDKKKKILGLIISSIIFGIWHVIFGWGPLKAVNMFFVGLVFGGIYLKYGFKGSILCHYANNFMSLIGLGLLF
ncbi:MAG: CPBP family intramembrane metalloprotease [Nanoarchaeota archaeon]|nr:CPBP family intramembrane metalloprotease [Nanoarchaeota archaeon]